MAPEMNRRGFVKRSVVASAGAALAMNSQAGAGENTDGAPAGQKPDTMNQLPMGKIGDMEISRLMLGGNLLTHYTHSRDLKYVYSLAKHYNTEREDPADLSTRRAKWHQHACHPQRPPRSGLLQKHRQNGAERCSGSLAPFTRWSAEILPRFNTEIDS